MAAKHVTTIYDIPEVARWRRGGGLVRIPPGVDVPLTDRVRRLIDTAPFRRLSRISQLGLVSFVYPAANHSRQEHSLGVYLAAIEYLDRLASDKRFTDAVSPKHAERLLVAALLHDVGHSPFGHPIEDLRLPAVTPHEQRARRFLVHGEVADAIREDWSIDPEEIAALVAGEPADAPSRILCSILSGPIDVDKVDYLMRDSLHAGVPYGQHFDRRRLVGSLCLNQAGDALAVTDKGKTAAEMMVFARYVMFSEVYWHHAVRSATAMLQRAFYLMHESLDLDTLVTHTDEMWIQLLREATGDRPPRQLLDGLFGPKRALYKRLAQFSYFEEPAVYTRLARHPYPRLVEWSAAMADVFSRKLGQPVAAHDVLVDAPPVELEVDFNIDVYFPKQDVYRPLGEVSPVVRTLAREQFDDYVKRVRVFIHPRLLRPVRELENLAELLIEAIDTVR